jgi:hypothetical protein
MVKKENISEESTLIISVLVKRENQHHDENEVYNQYIHPEDGSAVYNFC